MNIATDLIEREHEDIERCITAFERKPHRSRALDLCDLVERHSTMEKEVLYPLMEKVDQDAAQDARGEHETVDELVDRAREASDRKDLRAVVGELAQALRDHLPVEERTHLPAMEDELGVARMNELGMDLLSWQHRTAREQRESEENLEELLALTRAELYEKAQAADLDGRSTMKKAELAEALAEI